MRFMLQRGVFGVEHLWRCRWRERPHEYRFLLELGEMQPSNAVAPSLHGTVWQCATKRHAISEQQDGAEWDRSSYIGQRENCELVTVTDLNDGHLYGVE